MKINKVILIFFILILFSSFVSAEAPFGGVEYFDFSNNTGQWFSTGGTSDAQSVNAFPTFNISGDSSPNSYSFNGANEEMNTQQTKITENFTVSLWINSTTSTDNRAILGAYDGTRHYTIIPEPGGTIAFQIYDGANWLYGNAPEGNLFDGNWNHLLIEHQLGNNLVDFYLNNIKLTTTYVNQDTPSPYTLTKALFVGARNNRGNPDIQLAETVDELKFFNRTLTSEEKLKLYNYGNSNYTPPLPTPGLTINISDSIPTNLQSFITPNVDFNLSANTSFDFNCSLFLDSVINETLNFSNGNGINVSFNKDLSIGSHTYFISCFDNETSKNTTLKTFYIDLDFPDFVTNLESNTTFWTFNYNISINTTEMNPKNFTAIHSCGKNYSNTTLIQDFNLSFTTNVTNCSLGSQTTILTLCDIADRCTSKAYIWENRGSFFIQAKTTSGAIINNFSIYIDGVFDGNTTNGIYRPIDLINGTYELQIIPVGFQWATVNLTLNQTLFFYNFTGLFTKNSINITFYNSDTLALITGKNITVQFIGLTAQTNITNTSTLFVDLFSPDSYTILYDSTDFQQGKYQIHLTEGSFSNLNLYLQPINTSTLLLITVEDRFGTTLEGVEVIIQKYSNDAWRTDQILLTDFKGQAEGYYVLSTTYYNHVLNFGGTTFFGIINNDAKKKLIYTEDVTNGIKFILDTTGEDLLSTYQESYDTQYNLTYINTSNSTGYFRLFFQNLDNLDVTFCLNVSKGSSLEYVDSTCSTSSTGILTININSTVREYYSSIGYLNTFPVISYSLNIGEDLNGINWGVTGYFLAFFICIIAFFMFLSNPTLSIMVGSIAFVLLGFFGIIFKDMNYGIFLFILVLSYLVASIKSDSGVNA